MKCRRLTAEPLNARSCFEKESLKEDHKYGLEIKESGEVEHCVKFGPVYNPFRVCMLFEYDDETSLCVYVQYRYRPYQLQ